MDVIGKMVQDLRAENLALRLRVRSLQTEQCRLVGQVATLIDMIESLSRSWGEDLASLTQSQDYANRPQHPAADPTAAEEVAG